MPNIRDFIHNEDPTAANIITLFGCLISLAIAALVAFTLIAFYVPKLLLVLVGLFFAGCWYRMYKLGYLTPRKNTKD